MTIRLHDTNARQIRDFVPLTAGCVSIYLCGATVQAAPHIGHIRSGLNFDIMRRWFAYRGYDVTFIRNVTDIDDKIIAKSAEQGRPWWSIGYENMNVKIRELDLVVPFEAGEELRTEVSAKFRREDVREELAAAGMRLTQWWTDSAGRFALSLATAV